MNPQVKEKWLAALRNGQYVQTSHELRNELGHCCLGVLCEIAVSEGIISPGVAYPPAKGGSEDYWLFDGAKAELPTSVMEWAGLMEDDPHVEEQVMDGGDRVTTLAEMNDKGYSFAEIAAVIQDQL